MEGLGIEGTTANAFTAAHLKPRKNATPLLRSERKELMMQDDIVERLDQLHGAPIASYAHDILDDAKATILSLREQLEKADGEVKRLESLAADHFRNSRRLAERVATLQQIKDTPA